MKKKKFNMSNFDSIGSLKSFLGKHEDIVAEYSSSKNTGYIKVEDTGTNNFEEAMEMLSTGNPEIMKGLKNAVKHEIDKLNQELMTKPTGFKKDVEGLFFDVGLLMSGEPECWFKKPTKKTEKPKLDIYVLANYGYRTLASEIIKNSAKVIAVIKALEDAGIDVSMKMLFASESVYYGKVGEITTVTAKGYGETFNWAKISAMLHPSFYRRIQFRVREINSVNIRKKLRGGYGYSLKVVHVKELDMFDHILSLKEVNVIDDFKNKIVEGLNNANIK